MGLRDSLRTFFNGSKSTPSVPVEDEHEKARVAEKIVDLVSSIKRINSFDSSVWNLSNVSSYELRRKSLDELNRLYSSLQDRYSELSKPKSTNPRQTALEEAKWTGKRPNDLSDYEFDRLQRDESR